MTRPHRSVTFAAALAAAALAACTTLEPAPGATAPAPGVTAPAPAAARVLQGSVVHAQKTALPDDAKVKVQLVDVKGDPVPVVVAETTFSSGGRQVPLPFSLPVDLARVQEGRSYALRAYIEYGGRTQFVTATRVNVNPHAMPATVAILVTPGESDAAPTESAPPPNAMRPRAPSRNAPPRGPARQK